MFVSLTALARPVQGGSRVFAWGGNYPGQTELLYAVPSDLTNVVAIAAGARHALALRADGTVAAWGNDNSAQTNVPPHLTAIVAIAAGGDQSLALRADGSAVSWGNNAPSVPLGLTNVVAIAAGSAHNLALRRDGTIAAWGDNSAGQIALPVGLNNIVAVAAGGMISTAYDLARWIEALYGGNVLKPGSLTAMTQWTSLSGSAYGLGTLRLTSSKGVLGARRVHHRLPIHCRLLPGSQNLRGHINQSGHRGFAGNLERSR